jgi:hypothetical protein
LFPQQWHLVNDEFPEHMMNATPVWEMGFTGKGIISSLVDDGLDYTSEDLVDNFVRRISRSIELIIMFTWLRMLTIPTILMTMSLFRLPKNMMIITGLAVLDKLLP